MLTFGDVPDASQNASCVGMSPLSTFRPDGDESSVVGQKDVVEVSVQTDTVTAPFSWRASVYREDGVLVRRDFFSGVSALFSFTWDGRDQNERILSPGKYVIKVHPMDASGNAGADCEHDVQLNNVVGD